jgi:hypothetical protein
MTSVTVVSGHELDDFQCIICDQPIGDLSEECPGPMSNEVPEPPEPCSEGDYILVSWSEERYSPIDYHSFGVGPFSAKVYLSPGEAPEQKVKEAHAALDRVAQEVFKEKLRGFLARAREAGLAVSQPPPPTQPAGGEPSTASVGTAYDRKSPGEPVRPAARRGRPV